MEYSRIPLVCMHDRPLCRRNRWWAQPSQKSCHSTKKKLPPKSRPAPLPLQGYLGHKKQPSPWDHQRSLGMGLLYGPYSRRALFIMSEASLYPCHQTQPRFVQRIYASTPNRVSCSNLIAASIDDEYSVGPSFRPICTR